MNKTGFIVKNSSKGRDYYYLRKSVRENKTVKKINLYSFGSQQKALESLHVWKYDIEKLPRELKELGYVFEDICKWIEQIENK